MLKFEDYKFFKFKNHTQMKLSSFLILFTIAICAENETEEVVMTKEEFSDFLDKKGLTEEELSQFEGLSIVPERTKIRSETKVISF